MSPADHHKFTRFTPFVVMGLVALVGGVFFTVFSAQQTQNSASRASGGVNMLSNPGCENGTTYFKPYQSSLSTTTANPRSGSSACKLTSTGGAYYDMETAQTVPNPTVGQVYSASAWVRADSNSGRKAYMVLRESGGPSTHRSLYGPGITLTTEWQQVVNTITVQSSGRTSLDFYVIQDPGAAGQVFYIDDLNFVSGALSTTTTTTNPTVTVNNFTIVPGVASSATTTTPTIVNYTMTTSGSMPVQYLVAAVRNSSDTEVDFPGDPNITLAGTQTFTKTRTYPPGTYTYWLVYEKNGIWIDITPKKTFTIATFLGTATPTPTKAPTPTSTPVPTATPVPTQKTVSVSPTTIGANGTITIAWNGNSSPTVKDWVGVMSATSTLDANPWVYTSSCSKTAGTTAKSSGSCTLAAPAVAGVYSVKLLQNDSFVLLASGNSVTVTAAAATPTPTPTTGPATLTSTPTATQPTSTPIPTPTVVPGGTNLNFALALHGLGKGGDSANPNGTGNTSPVRPQRTVAVDVYDANNALIKSTQGTVSYDNASGQFKGLISLGTGINSGAYTLRIKTNQFLRTLVPGIQSLSSGNTFDVPLTAMVSGDINNDNTINILDYNILMGCYSDLSPAVSCAAGDNLRADITDDSAVNQFDYNLFLRELANRSGQ
jgi:hypothetical protein